MKRAFIRKTLDKLFKDMDTKGFRKCEVMELTMKTSITRKAEMFVSVEAVIKEPGGDGKTYKIREDFDYEP